MSVYDTQLFELRYSKCGACPTLTQTQFSAPRLSDTPRRPQSHGMLRIVRYVKRGSHLLSGVL
jgi:hypothetical protein